MPGAELSPDLNFSTFLAIANVCSVDPRLQFIMSEFLARLPPPGTSLQHYARAANHDAQVPEVPSTFLDAMSVRELVFVNEQKVPLENEFDADDARSWHWVTYASVATSSSHHPPPGPTAGRRQSTSTTNRLAVGTVRLVPPPHPPHPTPGSSHQIDNSETTSQDPTASQGVQHERTGSSSSHQTSQDEPYVKLGRLAILPPYRRLGLGKLLVNSALEYAAQHPEKIVPPMSAADREAARVGEMSGPGGSNADLESDKWKGLVLIHAQKHTESTYKKMGFVRDEEMGEWDEENIPHIGMWKRLPVVHQS